MTLWPRALSLRLALLFAGVSALLFGSIGIVLYQALKREIVWRDDQSLLGRVERMRSLIGDSDGIDAVRRHPQLYENMLANRENQLWVLDESGHALIEINPAKVALPQVPPLPASGLGDGAPGAQLRFAWLHARHDGQSLTLIAGLHLAQRDQMLRTYAVQLLFALVAGTLLAFALGWIVTRRGLQPVRTLAARALEIDAQHLHLRLHGFNDLRELQALSKALNQMLDKLEQGFVRLSRFSEDLAHEMRTPLSNLMGQTQQALQRPRPAERYQDLLASNLEEYERLARMIENMLFLARAEHPQTSIARELVALDAVAAQLCEYFEGMAEERSLSLVNLAEGTLICDPGLLRRALANLLANALRYAETGSVVTVATETSVNGLAVTVHNLGLPIPAEDLPRLFDRFYRRDPSRAEAGDSGGLGLAIVRSIMQLHSGTADVRSDPAGIAFVLRFPVDAISTDGSRVEMVTRSV
ncbi:MAG: heavy metal sensor histidine kinase [Burkholderiales bacterium]